MRLILLFTFLWLTGCDGCGLSERCYEDRERERFIRLTFEEREGEREECPSVQLYKDKALTKKIDMTEYCQGFYAYLHREPTPEELERLKNEKK